MSPVRRGVVINLLLLVLRAAQNAVQFLAAAVNLTKAQRTKVEEKVPVLQRVVRGEVERALGLVHIFEEGERGPRDGAIDRDQNLPRGFSQSHKVKTVRDDLISARSG